MLKPAAAHSEHIRKSTGGNGCMYNGGNVFLPKVGIPLQSPLSPFFAALYLTELDQAFTNRKGIFYLRFGDDVLILVENKRQYQKARRRLFALLKALRLKISPNKTRVKCYPELASCLVLLQVSKI